MIDVLLQRVSLAQAKIFPPPAMCVHTHAHTLVGCYVQRSNVRFMYVAVRWTHVLFGVTVLRFLHSVTAHPNSPSFLYQQ